MGRGIFKRIDRHPAPEGLFDVRQVQERGQPREPILFFGLPIQCSRNHVSPSLKMFDKLSGLSSLPEMIVSEINDKLDSLSDISIISGCRQATSKFPPKMYLGLAVRCTSLTLRASARRR